MKADLLKKLLEAHVSGDGSAFRKTALQLAADESNAGHIRIAEQIRQLVSQMPVASAKPAGAGQIVDIAQPRGELADLLEGGHRDERLRDMVLSQDAERELRRLLDENRRRTELESWGVSARRKVLFHGPPGCGKTLAARVIAGELGLPLMTVRFDALFSRYLGATAGHLKVIFDEMPRRPAVYFFDEFDAVGKVRGDSQDVGEVRRVVTTFLQLIDADTSPSIIIAATNFAEILDPAMFRRFDLILPFTVPTTEQARALILQRLGQFKLSAKTLDRAAAMNKELSFAEIAMACDQAIRTMVLASRSQLRAADLHGAIAEAVERHRRLRAD